MIDLAGNRPVSRPLLETMAQTMIHRGPDEDGYLERPGIGFVSRRLSIVGLADGRQPVFNEDRSVGVVYNGELFDYPEVKASLEGRGHSFRTHCDTELIPHLWEDHAEDMFERLRGQFAVALWDEKKNRVVLGRDRFGICPLYWARRGDWLLFASEIKPLLATGMVEARADPRGINQLFSFFAIPGPVTCFEGVQLLPPGHFLRIQRGSSGSQADISEKAYWEINFPDQGKEDPGEDKNRVVDGFEEVMLRSVNRRLRADVPVVSYLSGGVDSSVVVALASKVLGRPIPTFTIRILDPLLDEVSEAAIVSRHVGTNPIVVACGRQEVLDQYPRLIQAAEAPVIDTSCAALLMLAERVHREGYKVALTGEGADEWFAGYPWYKVFKLLSWMDIVPGLPLSIHARRAFLWMSGTPTFSWSQVKAAQNAVAGHNAWLDIYGLISINKLRFYNERMMAQLNSDTNIYAEAGLDRERMKRWHPLNRALAIGIRILLGGHLLTSKGDRVAMHSSVETRYPFLDEDVYDYVARLHPRWKMPGFRDKYLLRLMAERWLPKEIAWRKKAMFRAPFDGFYTDPLPPLVDQLLSPESLRKANYFEPAKVEHWRQAFRGLRSRSYMRDTLEMGLVGVLSTQLWHHTFIDGSLADLPSLAGDALKNGQAPAKTGQEPIRVGAS
jgi:asparagine synthase (glutamine-hydrolysing)